MCAGFWAPQRAGDRNGPSRWMPAIRRRARIAPASHSAMRSDAGGELVDRRGDEAGERRRRAVAAMEVAAPPPRRDRRSSSVWPPPPCTWMSTNPGTIVQSVGDAAAAGIGPCHRRPRSRPPSISTYPDERAVRQQRPGRRRTIAVIVCAAPAGGRQRRGRGRQRVGNVQTGHSRHARIAHPTNPASSANRAGTIARHAAPGQVAGDRRRAADRRARAGAAEAAAEHDRRPGRGGDRRREHASRGDRPPRARPRVAQSSPPATARATVPAVIEPSSGRSHARA